MKYYFNISKANPNNESKYMTPISKQQIQDPTSY